MIFGGNNIESALEFGMQLKLVRFFIVSVPCFIAIFTIAGVANAGIVIDADRQYNYAQSRFEKRAYDEAVIEFNRFIYFFPTDTRIPKADFQIGMAHFHSGRYKDALPVFDRLSTDPTDEALAADAYVMLSRSHAGLGKFDQAMVDLRNLMAVSSNPDVVDRAHYELTWLFIDQRRWKEAKQAISEITADNAGRFQVDALQRELNQSDQIPRKSPTTAGILSILPGAGQAYCGRYKDALAALLVNTGLIWAGWEAFDNDLYALGSVIGFVGFGFYAGNIYGAISSAHKYNRKRNSEFRNGLVQKKRVHVSLSPVPDGWTVRVGLTFLSSALSRSSNRFHPSNCHLTFSISVNSMKAPA
jgi:tetratricopeptide (TPR) repeat protein